MPYVADPMKETAWLAMDGRTAPEPDDSMTNTKDKDGEPIRFLSCPTAGSGVPGKIPFLVPGAHCLSDIRDQPHPFPEADGVLGTRLLALSASDTTVQEKYRLLSPLLARLHEPLFGILHHPDRFGRTYMCTFSAADTERIVIRQDPAVPFGQLPWFVRIEERERFFQKVSAEQLK